jgi:hypothetical protein
MKIPIKHYKYPKSGRKHMSRHIVNHQLGQNAKNVVINFDGTLSAYKVVPVRDITTGLENPLRLEKEYLRISNRIYKLESDIERWILEEKEWAEKIINKPSLWQRIRGKL